MEETQTPLTTRNEEIGLLDMLVTVVENAKLLILGPLLVGLCALGIGFMLPQTYESVAVLQAERPVDPQNTPVGLNSATVASLMATASVLDPVAVTLGLVVENDIEEARRKLREQIKPSVGRTDKLLTLTVSASSSQQAQALARAVLRQTYIQSRPKGSDRSRLESQLAAAKTRAENAQNAAVSLAKRLESPGASVSNDLARSYADLLTVTAAAQAQATRLEAEIEGLSDAQLVQEPTLPKKASQPKKGLMAIGATLAVGLVLMLFVFVRQALRNTAANARVAGKLARIRQSLGLK
ncbi:Wzz/FepE/Etk N-terminal domain-containing protein [Polaromonas jejuensis]|uniref:Wzz/FepE/Etk N-terminal domain-containing protein n=1 Tax=Polaromonas jejuensis TaxID=457502 RepID=A0ABW0Q6V6_9BURK|nr:Wzz/FepE/Etk N-terminal domain-containing protein [Polaromonas jejuensis]